MSCILIRPNSRPLKLNYVFIKHIETMRNKYTKWVGGRRGREPKAKRKERKKEERKKKEKNTREKKRKEKKLNIKTSFPPKIVPLMLTFVSPLFATDALQFPLFTDADKVRQLVVFGLTHVS